MTKIFKESIISNVNDSRVKEVLLDQQEESKLGTTRENLPLCVKNLKNAVFFDQ